MSAPQNPRPSGKYRRLTQAEVQAELDQQQEQYPEDLRARPIVSISKLASEHPNEWVALLPTEVDETCQVTRGHLILTALRQDTETFEKETDALRAQYGGLPGLYTFVSRACKSRNTR